MSGQAKLRNWLATALAPLLQRWHQLNGRQQQIFGGLAALLALGLLLAYVWLPAVRERDRLTARLPQLSAQLAQVKQQAAEVRELTATSVLAPAPPVAPDVATLQSMFGEGARVSIDANRGFRIVIPRIAYANWWDRVGDVQARHALQVVSLTLQALPGSSREVSVDMVLADRAQARTAATTGAAK